MKRVLLVRLSAMGDLMQSLGPIQALLEVRPDWELHLLTQSSLLPLVQNLGLHGVHGHDRAGGLKGWLRTRRLLREYDFDLAVDLQGNWKSAVAARLAGARRCLGAARSHRREPASARLLKETLHLEGARHPHATAAELLAQLAPELTTRPAQLRSDTEEQEELHEVLREQGIDPTKPCTVLVVAATEDNRAWPISAMRSYASRCTEQVLWLRGPAEARVVLPEEAHQLFQGAGSLRQLVALGCHLREVGGRVLGPDVGTTHVLNACGVPTSALFGPQDPARTAPAGAAVLLLDQHLKCRPCSSRRCTHPEGPVCMDIDPDLARRED